MASLSYINASRLIDLLRTVNSKRETFVSVLSSNRLAVGEDPLAPTFFIDLSKEKVIPITNQSSEISVPETNNNAATSVSNIYQPRLREQDSEATKFTRRGEDCWMELEGKRIVFRSQKELLSKTLIRLEEYKPGTLERLSKIKPRSRRIVALDPKMLFDNQDLVKDHSEKLVGDWWYGTNNSGDQVNSWLQRACVCAGLNWNRDFKIGMG